MWVRGLKLLLVVFSVKILNVAPYVGAWIETDINSHFVGGQPVAPYVGAWIETEKEPLSCYTVESHPMWVRGLKLKSYDTKKDHNRRTLCGCVD